MAPPLGLTDELRLEGIWWLPDAEDHRVPGILTFNQADGATLKLSGSLKSNVAQFLGLDDCPVIHGIVTGGKAVTLLDALHTQRQGGLTHLVTETYCPHFIAIGYHFQSEDDVLFTKTFVRFDNIEEWLGDRFFDIELREDGSSFDVHIDRAKEQPLEEIPDGTLSKGSAFYSDQSSTEVTTTVQSFVALASNEPRSLAWHFIAVGRVQALASLCAGRHLQILSVELSGPDEQRIQGRVRPASVHLYAQMVYGDGAKRNRRNSPLLTLSELMESNAKVFAAWFKGYEDIPSALNLFLATLGESSGFMDVRFTLAIQALEVFHRQTDNSKLVDDDANAKLGETLIAAIPADTPEAMREKIERSFAHMNEPSLFQRLRAMVTQVEAYFGSRPPGFSNTFLRRVVATRNYHTHYSDQPESQVLTDSDMHYATRRMVLLLTVLLFMRLGVPPDKITTALGRDREFRLLWENRDNPS